MSTHAAEKARTTDTPAAGTARRRQALEFARSGRLQEASQLCRAIVDEEPEGRQWLADEIVAALEQPRLDWAGRLGAILTAIERGSVWHPTWMGGHARPLADTVLSTGKLRHDIDQLLHLRNQGVVLPFDELFASFKAALERLARLGLTRAPLSGEDERNVGGAYGRLVHVSDAPRLARALSPGWDRREVEQRYLQSQPKVVVIDDFLAPEALQSLLRFCRDSTIWAGNRYAHDRLSSLFFTGFNTPLVLQIAEEIRDAFPLLIGARHPLRQLWAFKNTGVLPSDSSIHADFAAVNVNFWITPDEANLHPTSGGMVVYDLEAPLSWSFGQYNEQPELIHELMARYRPRAIHIPYRQNRAIIFNSDLFHGTEAVCFQPEYPSHRINVTMLYGDRCQDEHHAEPAQPQNLFWPAPTGWRSAALTRRKPPE